MNLIPQIIRLAATAIIWTALTLILVLGNLDSDTIVWVTLILGIVAGLSTMYIWDSSRNKEDSNAESAKRKRTRATTRLIEALDEDEVVQLEDLLAARREDRLSE
ncbi:MAG: hypothetical protein K8L99_12365 [Anaerolineae bacterium]|nr:hypothetical protein [Anaerolineae bacterium]